MSIHRAIIRSLLDAPMSLGELQSSAQVSLPTLRRAVQELSDAQWIRVVGQAEANGGRPAMLFGLDGETLAILGVHLQLPGIRLITTDLTGQVLDEAKFFDQVIPAPGDAVQAIVQYADHVRAAFPERQILGVGIGAPGFVDLPTGDILSIGRVPGWENFPFCRRVEAALGVPVQIANDVDCMAFAEFQNVYQPADKNWVYVGFDEGVKMSLFLQGTLYRGTLGNVGLIGGHLLHVDDPLVQANVQSWLTLTGINRIFEERCAELPPAEGVRCREILSITNPRQRFREILSSATEPGSLYHDMVEGLVQALAVTVTNTILLMQPNLVVMGGLLTALQPDHFQALEAGIRQNLPSLVSNHCIIQQGQMISRNMAALGATYHFLQGYLNASKLTTDITELRR
jgi:predicted NBD/HSP70 family sugar kinase